MDVTLERLGKERCPEALALLVAAGLPGAVGHLGHYLEIQPDGYWLALEQGRAVGVGGALRLDGVAFVGAMAVLDTHRGKGVGAAILRRTVEDAQAHGCRTCALEATALGEPVYARAGFVVTGETRVWQRVQPACAAIPLPQQDWEACVALDRQAVGFLRGGALAVLRRDARWCGVDGGFGMAWQGRVGPWVARDAALAEAVLDALLPHAGAAGTTVSVYVPQAARDAPALLAARGFAPVRTLKRMVLGPVPPARDALLWGLATAGMG